MNSETYRATLRTVLATPAPQKITLDGFHHAAVLVPLIGPRDSQEVLLTVRTHEVEAHKGQISFPGGVIETSDRDPVEAALRETEEELGIDIRQIQPVGFLDDHATPSGFVITPVVGVISSLPRLVPNPREVAEAFSLPLALFADERRARREVREFLGRTHDVWYYDTGTHIVWGATAAMIRNLLVRLGMLPAARARPRGPAAPAAS